ncbi:MAG: iron ABC transporter substrate-binding protein [Planctomycetes bacterium]|nr:iron ABC transporter substrate-binding protein [Planctomycetota bacterium]
MREAGPWVVTFEDLDRGVEVPDNANLREVCLREDVPLYRGLARLTNCSGRAKCGTCRVTVIEGADALSVKTPLERRHAVPGDDVRLACQANVRGPVTVRRGG